MINSRKIIAVLMILALTMGLASCGVESKEASTGETNETRIFVDSAGREVEIPAEIDAIAPSGPLAQIVLYTACPDRLAGIAVEFPDDAKALIDEKYWGMTKFGQFYGKNASLNMEALIEAAPDIVVDIGEAKETVVEDMNGLQEQLNIPVIFIEATLDNMDETYDKIGELIGDKEKMDELAAYCADVQGKVEKIGSSLNENEKVTVYQALGDAGLNTNARGSFQGEVMDKVNALNVADLEVASAGGGSEISMEQLLRWNPEVIIAETDAVYSMITTDGTWAELDAVKNGKVYKIPTRPYSAMGNPPSVNRVFGLLWLGNTLYPDQYQIDIKDEMQKFYKLFYHIDVNQNQINEILGI